MTSYRYPDFKAGMKLTEARLEAMLPEAIVKSGNTDRASTTTPTLDPELQFSGVAGGVYLVEFILWPAAVLAADFRTEWQVPVDASGLKMVFGPSSTASDGSADNILFRAGVHGFTTDVIYSGVRDSGSSAFNVLEAGVVTLVSAGTIGLNWAQGTSSATASRLCIYSQMTVTRLA